MNIDTSSKQAISSSLDYIAKDLILNKAIKINNRYYSFIDVEIYYWHFNHPDDFARGVNHNKPAGELEAHRYGIDLSLGNEPNIEFGGILICGLFDNQNKINCIIEKPHVIRTLFNQLQIGDNTIEVVKYKNTWHEIFRSKRLNLGNENSDNKTIFKNSPYKYLAKDGSLFKGYKGKELIFKNSTLTENEVQKMLGYKLTR